MCATRAFELFVVLGVLRLVIRLVDIRQKVETNIVWTDNGFVQAKIVAVFLISRSRLANDLVLPANSFILGYSTLLLVRHVNLR